MRPRHLALAIAAGLIVGSLMGCASPINGRALLPASQADLDLLKEDVDADRTNTAAGFDAVRKDLAAANVATPETEKAHGAVVAKADEVAARPASGGIGGALINELGGNLPGWLDWLITLGAGALGINVTRNASRKKVLGAAPPAAKPATAPAT